MRLQWLASGFVAAVVAAACGGTGGAGGGGDPTGAGGTGSPGGAAGKAGAAAGGKGGAAGASAGSAGKPAGGAAGATSAGMGGAAATGGSSAGAGGGKAGAAGATAGSGGAAAGAAGKGGSAGTGAGGASGGGAAGAPVVTACATSADCAGNPTTKICDPTTGICVGCLPSADMCPMGQYCKIGTHQCSIGCKADKDCSGTPSTPHCDLQTNQCKQCLGVSDCAAGNICVKGICAAGCDATKPCTNGLSCCDTSCHDEKIDLNNCGGCGIACKDPPNAKATCSGSKCGLVACQPGFADCNLDPSDGCEVNTATDGACKCKPGDTIPCYTGPAGTANVGLCKGGVQTCAPSGVGYIPGCIGEVLPTLEQCGGADHDCNGTAGDVPDVDGDGWNACQGDCCEDTTQCSTPKAVNPGAYDLPGDMVDNDCNGGVDNPLACGGGQKLGGVSPADGATAIELCQTTAANPPLAQRTWGVLAADWLLADGSIPSNQALSDIENFQAAVIPSYGNQITPHAGPTMLGMSSGRMRDKVANNNGQFVPVIGGSSFSTSVQPPTVYTSQHGGGLLPGKCGGTVCPVGSGANDSVNLRLQIRVPTNAPSFTYEFRFFSGEYQTFQCTAFNDYFLALLTTGAAGIPGDHNISFDAVNNPVSVNNGFFQVCGGNGKNCAPCPNGAGELAGTGMDDVNGGGTLWLTTTAPVVPGENMTLDLTIFDVGDHIYDSLVVVDNFKWSATPSGPPTTKPSK